MNKILTISIAAYNASKYISECLDSITDIINVGDLDIIVVNDGSEDNTLNIVNGYKMKFPNSITIINKDNGGWGSTINEAIKIAKGKYFKILDADDLFFNTKLDRYIAFLKAMDADVIMTKYASFINNDKNKYKIVDDNLLQMHMLTFNTKMLQDSKIHITEHCYYTDVEVVLKGMCCAKNIDNYDDIIYLYRIGNNEQSVSDENYIKNIEQHFTVLSGLVENDYNNEDLKNRLIHMIIKHYAILFKLPITTENKIKIKKFDLWLKNGKYYNDIKINRVLLFRRCDCLYPLICIVLKIRSTIYKLLNDN